mmetsp:Transcript_27234/g.42310  ORF Transcript_27234/g.42310 Transcript_27234/m.42310 type:complete len:257 (+) Transcript_27234:82-852(+)
MDFDSGSLMMASTGGDKRVNLKSSSRSQTSSTISLRASKRLVRSFTKLCNLSWRPSSALREALSTPRFTSARRIDSGNISKYPASTISACLFAPLYQSSYCAWNNSGSSAKHSFIKAGGGSKFVLPSITKPPLFDVHTSYNRFNISIKRSILFLIAFSGGSPGNLPNGNISTASGLSSLDTPCISKSSGRIVDASLLDFRICIDFKRLRISRSAGKSDPLITPVTSFKWQFLFSSIRASSAKGCNIRLIETSITSQ